MNFGKHTAEELKKALLATFLTTFLVVESGCWPVVKKNRPDYRITDGVTIQSIDEKNLRSYPEPVKLKTLNHRCRQQNLQTPKL